MTKRKILVTGANGLLGHQVVFQLLKQSYDIRIVVRSRKNIFFDTTKVELIEGNFYDYETLKTAALGCSAIIHIAAITATNLLQYKDYHKINVEASAQIIAVANELNIQNLVYVSTANTIGYGNQKQAANEESKIQFPFTESFYAQSKLEAEQLFDDASKSEGRHVAIIHPSFMIGDFDTKPSSGKLLLMAYKKRIMIVPSGGKNFVSASSVAEMICDSIQKGKNGTHYLATDRNMSFADFYRLQSKIAKYPQRIFTVPNFILILAGWFGDFLRKVGIKTDLCSRNIRQLLIREYYNNSKAVGVFGPPTKTIETAISEALSWFKKNKMIK